MSDGVNRFILSWDCLGIESVINITQIDHEITWDILQGKRPGQTVQRIAWSLTARARANEHRNYEIYFLDVESGVTEEDVMQMFRNDPQGSAELVRDRGIKIYSNRLGQEQRLIV
jgi:hypothetical protein